MKTRNLILILGDQLSRANPALADADPERDLVLMAEVAEEATYVPHNRHKIALIFSAMRHFAAALEADGFRVIYRRFDEDVESLRAACETAIDEQGPERLRVCAPGEHRLREAFRAWQEDFDLPVDILDDSRFLCSIEEFRDWADGRKQLRMEYFYREMRRRYRLLLTDDGEPEGGRWNYDSENRRGWRSQVSVPDRPGVAPDKTTREVIDLVVEHFPDNPGDLEQFRFAVTREDALVQFERFCDEGLPSFGTYQDALAEASPWLFHSLVSMYLNIGLLEPLEVCQRVEQCWRDGQCELSDAEGFIRQVLGWREYVRGIYWCYMPEYRERNTFAADTPLPEWFWTGKTDMRCLSRALQQTLELGYAHHIQRLMVIGNFALLAGLDVREVCDWYLAVYVDAFEWVELPNTLGMALHGDEGLMASKPYAASGKYIQRQGDHCGSCRYDVRQTTGEGACPFNSLYWRFIDRHAEFLASNRRMGLITANWGKRKPADRRAIIDWADQVLTELVGDPA